MRSCPEIITTSRENAIDSNLAKLLKFMGRPARWIRFDDSAPAKPQGNCGLLNFDLAAGIQPKSRQWEKLLSLINAYPFLLIYNIGSHPEASQLLSKIAQEDINLDPVEVKEGTIRVAREFPEESGVLSGISFAQTNLTGTCVFHPEEKKTGFESLIDFEGSSLFLQRKGKGQHQYLLAGKDVLDIDTLMLTSKQQDLALEFLKIIPYVMFMRTVYGDALWHTAGSGVNLIIDDPVFKKTYGFIDFKKFTAFLKEKGVQATFAYIPWNFKRSQKQTVELIRKNRDHISISYHGYAHTEGEFGSENEPMLIALLAKARKSMQVFGERTGLDFDEVMVFPQGVFSKEAAAALKKSGFQCAINTTLRDCHNTIMPDFRSFFEPVYLGFSNFPLFHRRYFKFWNELLLDVFIGKPLIVASHHDFFKNNQQDFVALTEEVAALPQSIPWMKFEDLMKNTYALKRVSENRFLVKLYFHETRIVNPCNHSCKMTFIKDVRHEDIQKAEIDGKEVAFRLHNHWLILKTTLGPGESRTIRLVQKAPGDIAEIRFSITQRIKIAARRLLSEFRDDVISKNERGLKLAYWLKGHLKRK